MSEYKETGICSICGGTYTHWGNNAYPVNNGRCCDRCNQFVVLPKRIDEMLAKKEDK